MRVEIHIPNGVDELVIVVGRSDSVGLEKPLSPYRADFPKKRSREDILKDRKDMFDAAYEYLSGVSGEVTVKALSEYLGVTEKTVKLHAREVGMLLHDGNVYRPYQTKED